MSIAEPHRYSDALTGPPLYNALLHSGDMRQRGLCFGFWKQLVWIHLKCYLHKYNITEKHIHGSSSIVVIYILLCDDLQRT